MRIRSVDQILKACCLGGWWFYPAYWCIWTCSSWKRNNLTTWNTAVILRLRWNQLIICPWLCIRINYCRIILCLYQRNVRLSCFSKSRYLLTRINFWFYRLWIWLVGNTFIIYRKNNTRWRSWNCSLSWIGRTRVDARLINCFESNLTGWTNWTIRTSSRHKKKISIHICRYIELRWKISSENECRILISQSWNEVSKLISRLNN